MAKPRLHQKGNASVHVPFQMTLAFVFLPMTLSSDSDSSPEHPIVTQAATLLANSMTDIAP